MNKKKIILIVLVIVAAALAYYFLVYKKTPAQQTAATPATGNNPAPVSGQTGVNISPNSTANSQALEMPSTTTTGQPSNSIDSQILAWINTLGAGNKARANAVFSLFTPAEKASLSDILNTWTAGKPVSAAQTAFWNSWRTKYHILDNTYNP